MQADPVLKRIERDAVIVCLAMAAVAAIAAGVRPAAGVLGGGLLSAVSYRTIGSGVAALTAVAAGERTAGVSVWTLAKAAGRYALLGLLAYVMIARLRLHPLGLLAGASSVVAAVSIEALRLLLKKS